MKRILVPIDFSKNSLNALSFGIKIANKLNADLRIIHVKTRKLAYRYIQSDAEAILNDSIEGWLEDILKKYGSEYVVPNGKFDYKVREGNVFKEVTNQAKYDDTTLLVIGTHGVSGFEDKWIGSNAYRLVLNAEVPVLTVRPEREWRGINRIVIPITINKASRQIVPVSVGLANLFNATVLVVGLKEKGYGLLQSRVGAFVRQTVNFIEKNTDLQVNSEIITGKSKCDALMDYATEKDADIISTNILHNANPLENMIKPMANQLINESECPVLAVPAKESLYL